MFHREVKAPRFTVRQDDKLNAAGVEGIVKRLPNTFFGTAGWFDLDKHRWLRCRMAEREISASFSSLILRPYKGCVPSVPAEFLQDAEHYPLGNRLFIWKSALPQPIGDVCYCGFQ